MKSLLPLSVTTTAGILVAPGANAACQRSCTEVAEKCVSMGASRAACFCGQGQLFEELKPSHAERPYFYQPLQKVTINRLAAGHTTASQTLRRTC
jgi:hypothetical protein